MRAEFNAVSWRKVFGPFAVQSVKMRPLFARYEGAKFAFTVTENARP